MKTTSKKILVVPVRKDGDLNKNELGLTLPDSYSMQGLEKVKVIWVGEENKDIFPDDTLLIYKGSGTKVTEGEQEYRVINVTDIVIIYE